jgi:pimeloyl-ACP methyl ester carboxylesterase
MTDYLLVHGGHHGMWCWGRVVPKLNALGHRAIAIDLPGRGATADRLKTVSLADWVTAIGDGVASLGTPPVLVAHSMGGVSTSQYAEHRPETILGVVYVSAVIPANRASGMQTLAEAGGESALLEDGVFSFSSDRAAATIDPEAAASAFFGRCPEDRARDAISRLCPEAIAPLATPLDLGRRFASVPKVYIGACDDRAVPPGHQKRLAARADALFQTIDADHSPFLSAVEALTADLHEIGQRLSPAQQGAGAVG